MRKIVKFSKIKDMFFDKEDLRWATPEVVADYRARRLKCALIVDLCCGIGGQSIFFGKYCKHVVAVEKDIKKIEYAKKNVEVYGIKNVEFILGDVLDKGIIKRIRELKPDIIFCDPSRLAEEKERKIDNITPRIDEIIHAYKTRDFAFEVPPQLGPEKISYDCEREYVSVNKALNRLTLYFGKLKRTDVSAVCLPREDLVVINKNKKEIRFCDEPKKFIYVLDTAVVKADLVVELIDDINNRSDEKNKLFFYNKDKLTLLTSDNLIKNDFLAGYVLIKKIKNEFSEILDVLKRNGFGKVLLRSNINPADYWRERKRFEDKLDGERTAHLFIINDSAIICEKVQTSLG